MRTCLTHKELEMSWIDEVNFDEEGLVPVVVQDVKTSRVLMLGWANKVALSPRLQPGEASTSPARGGKSGARASRRGIIRSCWACSWLRTDDPSFIALIRREALRAIRDTQAATGGSLLRADGASASRSCALPRTCTTSKRGQAPASAQTHTKVGSAGGEFPS